MSEKPTPESYGFEETRIPDIEREIERKNKKANTRDRYRER